MEMADINEDIAKDKQSTALQAFVESNRTGHDDEIRETTSLSKFANALSTEKEASTPLTVAGVDDGITEEIAKPSASQQVTPNSEQITLAQLASSSAKTNENAPARQPSLMDVAKTFNRTSESRASLVDVAKNTKSSSLLEVASKRQPSLIEAVKQRQEKDNASLVELAKANNVKQASTVAKVLGTIAVEEKEAVSKQVDLAMHEAVGQVNQAKDEKTEEILRKAVRDVHDAFEYKSSPGAVDRAVEILVDKSKRSSITRASVSVDRDVHRSRQSHGLRHPGPSMKPRKDQLSSFQLNHLTETQKRLLYATLVEQKARPSKKDNQAHMEYINRMATPLKPKKRVGKEQFAKDDDRRHCKFKPKLGRGSAESGRRSDVDDDDAKDNQDFIRRMEAAEKAKNEAIRRQRAERLYLAQIDKKECPKCGNPQSYAEVQQKRKQCPNCGVSYKSRLAWAEISQEFFERVEESEDQKQRNLEQIALEVTPVFRTRQKRVYNPRTNTFVTVKSKPLSWEEVEFDFMSRVRLDEKNRITVRTKFELCA
ncbi:unnamed protein product [Aphanomyces euteiches]|uniref:Uncharacterized protein n=1 Tax=Aphanomyces euteiches TaxID=100861 RepID=A0A6G0XK41_9STRA|nr:hypothetical protein Ae201684_003918 [Aphanomyces euteiches]